MNDEIGGGKLEGVVEIQARSEEKLRQGTVEGEEEVVVLGSWF